MARRLFSGGLSTTLAAAVLATVGVQTAWGAATGLTRVATGLTQPVFATYAPGDYSRLFILERSTGGASSNATGRIRVLDLQTGVLAPTPFLTIPNLDNNGEGGLVGLAFSPDYATSGKFYTYVTAPDAIANTVFSSYVREYTVSSNPNVANTSFNTVLTWGQPQNNHNGGWIGFGPNDGYLYVASGDGGNGNDQGPGHTEPSDTETAKGNAQDLTNNFLGKMLRVDVNIDRSLPGAPAYLVPPTNPFVGVDGDDEIWAYGLRNPFRDSFDRATGDLWIGDVGQDRREEIDFQAASSAGGVNYGWRLREGFIQTPTVGGAKPPGAVDPVYDYLHNGAAGSDPNFIGNAVIGGHIYRGPDPSLQGTYFFADETSSNFWSFNPANPSGTITRLNGSLPVSAGSAGNPTAIGEDAAGNLYLVAYGGDVFRINTNAVTPGDFDENATVDGADLLRLMANLGTTTGATRAMGDANGDGKVNEDDLALLETNFGWSPLNVGVTAAQSPVPEPASAALVIGAMFALAAAGRRR